MVYIPVKVIREKEAFSLYIDIQETERK